MQRSGILSSGCYGKKSEKGTTRRDTPPDGCAASSRSRGQQKGSQGHGRTPRPDLSVVEEERDVAPEDKKCCICGQAYDLLAQTEDSRIIEVQVKAHVRLIRRKMYTQVCECVGVPGLITAPPAPRLIPKSAAGISIWTEVLLNKFLFSRATYNLCTDYSYRGLPLAPGTLTGGLKRITPLFNPLIAQLVEKQLSEELFHNDETGWKVFEAIEGKVGYRWYLWVTQSPSVVYYAMAPSRSGDIPIDHFPGWISAWSRSLLCVIAIAVTNDWRGKTQWFSWAFCWAHYLESFFIWSERGSI